MSNSKNLFTFIFFLFYIPIFSQNETDESITKIESILNNFFDLEREAIHLHLNKTTFLNTENIWFQGYIINRKTNKPYFTTNVFVMLYDENGTQISEKLIYASNGIFFGEIELNSKLKSGHYYLQVYTNWMNNFGENESTITKIDIINPLEGIKNYSKINSETLEISINPEGKSYVLDVVNQLGIEVKDCRGNSPENLEVILQNDKNEELKTIKLNKFGQGKFEVTPNADNLKVSFKYDDKIIEKVLDKPVELGFALSINNFTLDDKVIVKISTNTITNNLLNSKKKYLIIHQDQKYNFYEVPLNKSKSELTFTIDKSDFFEGINTIRIIDSDLKQWAERLIYSTSKKETEITIFKNKNTEDKINLVGYSSINNSNISISVLPENSKSLDKSNSIIAGLTINPYLTQPLEHANYYLNKPGRIQRYELDLALLNQEKLKYEWNTIKMTTPIANYTFDIGIALKGTIDSAIKDKTYHKTKLISYKDFIMMGSDINEKGDYNFEHILLADSTYVSMSLQKLPNFEPINTTLRPQIIGRKRTFNKSIKMITPVICSNPANIEFITNFDMPKFNSNAIQLDEVKIENQKKKMVYQNRIGNGNLRAYKIDKMTHFLSVLNFIEMNGFRVVKNLNSIQIYSKIRSSINGAQATPEVYIDERLLMSLDELDMMSDDEVDEIYLDPYAIVPSMNNKQGIIKIYKKKNSSSNYKQKTDANSFYIKEGFARFNGFKNADYEQTANDGFDNYGLIHWSPSIKSDESGQFLFEITNYNKNKVKTVIDGMDSEGNLFHEEKVVELK
jgi:hypothetical protein